VIDIHSDLSRGNCLEGLEDDAEEKRDYFEAFVLPGKKQIPGSV